MKKAFNKFAVLSLLTLSSLAYFSCNDDDTEFGKKDKPTLSVVNKSYSVVEGQPFELQFTLDKAINDPIEYKLVIKPDGTAEDQMDYYIQNGCLSNDPSCVAIEENGGPVGYVFTVPAYTTNYTLTIETIADYLPEGTENFKVYVLSRRNLKGLVAEDTEMDLSITNYVSTEILARFDWTGTYMGTDGEEHDFCDLDLDLEFYDGGGNVVEYSYSSCPEEIITSSLPDGDFDVYASFWSLAGASPEPNQDIPFTVTVAKQGVWTRDLTFSGVLNTSMVSGEDGNPDAYIYVGTINRSGNIYTFTDSNGVQLEQGRHAAPKKLNRLKKSKRK
ncbi:hypothetical protein [Flavobacterium urocaniciphilum]|uniref:Calx-beta domain-containing protein n=1 Tax=Flavobacterium urocaniciphilum TaxID=1299341 RepID=A0A1H9C6K0_9FLAO|nr:hypothetical protein [Flavobacterium urocaniciphilum]SEP96621.1 hypothetical protein SAMN05444005_10465 [Flavobacterium urocaniciphilum]